MEKLQINPNNSRFFDKTFYRNVPRGSLYQAFALMPNAHLYTPVYSLTQGVMYRKNCFGLLHCINVVMGIAAAVLSQSPPQLHLLLSLPHPAKYLVVP